MDAERLSDGAPDGVATAAPAGHDVFIVGPARAGTSWLQTMLAEHADVASPPETELFSAYLVPMERAWNLQRARVDAAVVSGGERQLAYGLATVLDDDEFLGIMRSIYATVRSAVLAAKPGATRFLEKTPDHALFIDLMRRVAPGARFVVLVRDPRDTVRSLLEASAEPWGHWAPTSVEDGVALWLRNVRAALAHRRDPNLTVVRYEDLKDDPAELDRLAEFLGLGAPSTWLKSARDASPGERASMVVRGDAAEQGIHPYGARAFSFHDRGDRKSLSNYEQTYVVWRCRAEMQALGYATDLGRVPVRLHATRAWRAFRLRARGFVGGRGRRGTR